MDEAQNNDPLLIERYLQGRMSAEEAAEFEERFLSDDGLLDELEAAERLQQGLKDLETLENAAAARRPAGQRVSGATGGSVVTAIFRSPRYAMAASFALVLSLGYSIVLMQQNARLGGPEQGLAPAHIVPLVTVRGVSSAANTVQLAADAKQLVLLLDPGFEPFDHFRASVFRLQPEGDPQLLWQIDDLTPGYEDMLALSLPGSVLEPGNFEVRLEGWRDEWAASHSYQNISVIPFTFTDR